MPGPLTSKRLKGAATLATVLGVVYAERLRIDYALGDSSFFTGYVLLGALVFLALYNTRKRFAAAPLGASRWWMQLHVYTGLGSVAVFLMHTGLRWPDGWLEGALAALFVATAASGLLGLWWTRTLPPKLARVGEEVIYERIPALRNQVRELAEEAVLSTIAATGSTTLAGVYSKHLAAYFEQPREWGYLFWPTNRRRRALMADLTEASRFLSDAEQSAGEELFALVRKRDDLDYHAALQWRLKAWLFVHIALTYPLLVLASVHGLVAHAFSGGLP